MKVLSILGLSLSLSSIAHATEVALPEAVQKKVASVALENCGSGADVRLEPIGPENGAFNELMVLDFHDLSLEGNSLARNKSCKIVSRVKVKAGGRLRINSGSISGYSDLSSSTGLKNSELNFSYSFPLAGDFAATSGQYAAGSLKDAFLEGKIAKPRFSPCSNEDQVVELKGQIAMGMPAGASSSDALRVTGSTGGISGWKWGWGDCFTGAFTSAYKAYDGRTYNATFTLNGPETTYTSSAGFTARLYDLKRNGKVLTGKWASTSNSGYIEFRIEDFVSGRFTGEWGDLGADGTRYYKGFWNGYKVSSLETGSDYALSSAWQGRSKLLSHVSGHGVILASNRSQAENAWAIEANEGGTLKIVHRASKLCLDINSHSYQPQLATCGRYSGQFWQVIALDNSAHVRLKTNLTGSNMCLEVVNDGHNQNLRITACQDVSSQYWWLESRAP